MLFLHNHRSASLLPSVYTYDELSLSTNNFDTKRQIGDGGFGSVYLAHLCEGRLAAEKYLHHRHSSAAFSTKSFCNEILILSSINHPNLVKTSRRTGVSDVAADSGGERTGGGLRNEDERRRNLNLNLRDVSVRLKLRPNLVKTSRRTPVSDDVAVAWNEDEGRRGSFELSEVWEWGVRLGIEDSSVLLVYQRIEKP